MAGVVKIVSDGGVDEHDAVERATEDGLIIAEAAVRMAVKNRIIVAALRDGDDFDRHVVDLVVRSELIAIAVQTEENAERMMLISRGVRRAGGTGEHSGYRSEDQGALDRRRTIYEATAMRLRILAESEHELARLSRAARESAWHDVSTALDSRLAALATGPGDDADYLTRRAGGMSAIRREIALLEKAHAEPDGRAVHPRAGLLSRLWTPGA